MPKHELNEIVKSQAVRLADVLVIGPLMMYGAYLIPKTHPLPRGALFIFGASTIYYNWQNYQRLRGAPNEPEKKTVQK